MQNSPKVLQMQASRVVEVEGNTRKKETIAQHSHHRCSLFAHICVLMAERKKSPTWANSKLLPQLSQPWQLPASQFEAREEKHFFRCSGSPHPSIAPAPRPQLVFTYSARGEGANGSTLGHVCVWFLFFDDKLFAKRQFHLFLLPLLIPFCIHIFLPIRMEVSFPAFPQHELITCRIAAMLPCVMGLKVRTLSLPASICSWLKIYVNLNFPSQKMLVS